MIASVVLVQKLCTQLLNKTPYGASKITDQGEDCIMIGMIFRKKGYAWVAPLKIGIIRPGSGFAQPDAVSVKTVLVVATMF